MSQKLRISCIGLGKLGTALSRLFAQSNEVEIGALVGKSPQQVEDARQFFCNLNLTTELDRIGCDDIVMIAVKDQQIEDVARQLAQSSKINSDSIIFHCSGALTSKLISQFGYKNAASVHPMFSFAATLVDQADFRGTNCAFEGSEAAWDILQQLFKLVGAKLFRLSADKKVLYHSACVFAANFSSVMVEISERLFLASGIDQKICAELAQRLAASSFRNICELGFKPGITGPAVRRDSAVISQHINELMLFDPEISKLYAAITQRLIKLIE